MATQFRFTSRVDGQEVIITARTPEEARQQMRLRDARLQGSPAANLDPYALRLQQKGAEQRASELTTNAAAEQRLAGQAQSFMRANEMETGTGPGSIGSMVPFLRNAPSQQMQAIASELTPSLRQPGSGATSDFDARMFQDATLGLNKSPEVNRIIGMGYVARAKRMQERANAAEAWLADPKNLGTLVGFDAAWSKYSNDVPIFDPTSSATNPRLNSKQINFSDYVAGGMRVLPQRSQYARGESARIRKEQGLPFERITPDGTGTAQPGAPRRFRFTQDGKLVEQ